MPEPHNPQKSIELIAEPKDGSQDSPPPQLKTVGLPNTLRFLFIIAGLMLFALLLVSYFHPNMVERVKFFTVNALSLLVLVAIVAQAVIYRRQWSVMERQEDTMHEQLEAAKIQNATTEWQAGISEIQAGLIDKQVKVMQGQLEAINRQETHLSAQAEASKTQAEAMQKQLEAILVQSELAEKGIAHAEQSSIYANRAYVTARIEKIEEGFRFYLLIENKGNTPANDVMVAFSCRLHERPPFDVKEGKMVVYDSGFANYQRLGLIAPDGSHSVVTLKQPQIESDAWNRWKLGQLSYYVWGRIHYEDIFHHKRHTDFAFFQAHAHPNGYPCEHGNSAI
jgi:hypothetical protein